MDRISAITVISIATSVIGMVVAISMRNDVDAMPDVAFVAFFALACAAIVGWFYAKTQSSSTKTVEAIVTRMRSTPPGPKQAKGMDREA